MDISILTDYCNVIALGICLCIGFILKNFKKVPNKMIPLIMGILGVIVMVWINKWVATPETVLTGLISGLASTGLYETFKNLIGGSK